MALAHIQSSMFKSTKKGKKRPNLNESFDSFSMMSPDMKNMTSAKLKFMINNHKTFDLYNTKNSIGGTSKKKNNFKIESNMLKYDINKGESAINDKSDASLNTTFNQRDIKKLD